MKLQDYFRKLLRFLRVQPSVGGLEISDFALRFVDWSGGKWTTAGLRLPPGIVENGKVKDREQFIAALSELHSQIAGPNKPRKSIGVVVSLGSVDIYSRTFGLPMIVGENLERAINLNLQMASPISATEAYSGWQIVGEDKRVARLEVLSAFISREIVDEIVSALQAANFAPRSLEPKSLSLIRVIRELGKGLDPAGPYVVLSIDESGLELLIVRGAQLYFQYFTSWTDIYGGERQVSQEAFETALVRSLHQVMNFYRSRWSEPLLNIYLIAPGLKEEVARAIHANFSLNVLELQLEGIPATPDWFVALGAAMRGTVSPTKDREISLLGISARERFLQEQIISFLELWMILMPASLGVLLVALILGETFLLRLNKNLDMQQAGIMHSDQSAEIEYLQNKAEEFNRSIALLENALGASRPRFEAVAKMNDLLKAHGITLLRFWDQGSSLPITLNGKAKAEADIRGFVADLGEIKEFQNIDLPFSEIRPAADGVQFSVRFSFVSSSAP